MTAVSLQRYRDRLEDAPLLSCRGSVVRVTGLTIESQGPPVGVGQVCQIELASGRSVPAEVVGFNGRSRVLMPLEDIDGLAPGDRVVSRNIPRTLRLDDSVLGRVLNGLGEPMDDLGPLAGSDVVPLDNQAPPPLKRRRITEPLSLGIRAIDGLLTVGKGQRLGIFAGSGVGKSTLLGEVARVSSADVNVLVLVGERGREVREFIEESLGPEGLARSVVVVATSDSSPVQRIKAAFTGTAIAEYFRDRGRDVLFMMDSLTRFSMAQREVGLAAGEPPTTKGYCPSVFSLMPKLVERLGSTQRGSVTGVYTILVEGDDMSDPIADTARSLLDGHIVLDRSLADRGHHPAIDVMSSVSRLMSAVAGEDHKAAAQAVRAVVATYRQAEDLINIGALAKGANPKIDKSVELIDRVNEFLVQPTGTGCPMPETVGRLKQIANQWSQAPAAAVPAKVNAQ